MSLATECMADLECKLRSTNQFGKDGKKVFAVYSEEDLLDKAKILALPAVGVMYEGLVSGQEGFQREGLAATLRAAVVLVIDGKSIGGIDRKNAAAELLDACRNAIKQTASPTKHKWRFVAETPMGLMGGVLVYVQRWSTAAPNMN